MPDLSRMWKLWKQTTRIRDKGSELRSEHPPASSDMDDRENSPGGVLSWDKRDWVDPYFFGGKKRVNQLILRHVMVQIFVNLNLAWKVGVYDFQRCKTPQEWRHLSYRNLKLLNNKSY